MTNHAPGTHITKSETTAIMASELSIVDRIKEDKQGMQTDKCMRTNPSLSPEMFRQHASMF